MTPARIRIDHADGHSEERALQLGRYTIGRDVGDVVLNDPNTSAVHAELDVGPHGVCLRDQGSTNGTFTADGTRITQPYWLRPNEMLRLGSTRLTLIASAPAAGGTQVMRQVSPEELRAQHSASPSPGAGFGAPTATGVTTDPPSLAASFGLPANAPSKPLNYALWPQRVLGYLIDYALVFGGMGILYIIVLAVQAAMAVGAAQSSEVAAGLMGGSCCFTIALFPIATLAVGLWNRAYLVSSRGYSIGQGITNLRVVDANGNNLTLGAAALRLLAMAVLSMLPFGLLADLLWPLWDERRQTLHDKAVNSYVVRR